MASGTQDDDTPDLTGPWPAYVLEHPLRARMAAMLDQCPMDLPELAEALDEPLTRVTYHYGVLVATLAPGDNAEPDEDAPPQR